jgi:hypothetical protein
MHASFLLIALPALALANAPPSGSDMPGSDVLAPTLNPDSHPTVSVTSYMHPWSSGSSTWTVPTTVSYSTGEGWTSMVTAGASSAAAKSGESGSATGSETGKPSVTGEPYKGGAEGRVMGGMGVVGAVVGAVVAML